MRHEGKDDGGRQKYLLRDRMYKSRLHLYLDSLILIYMLHMLMFLKSQIIMRTRKPFGNIDGSREMVHMAQVVETTD